MNNLNIKDYQIEINQILANSLNSLSKENSILKASMVYSLIDGGKRVRPLLFMLILEAYGINPKKYSEVISAIEMIHTYSLVHDDLPAMDDDNLRRGKPTVHIKFDEATAILCGDALLTDAFYILSTLEEDPEIIVKLIRTLSLATGSSGMVYGQVLDMAQTVNDIDDIETMYYYKTGLLIQASITMAAIVTRNDISDFVKLGAHLGQAFQIQDDILEYTKTTEELGKDVNSDHKNNKKTIVGILGIEQAQLLVESYFDEIETLLERLDLIGTKFHVLILDIANREK